MTRLHTLISDLQQELVALGKIPAHVKTGSIELDMNQGVCAAVRPTYYAKIEREAGLHTATAERRV